MDTVFIYILLGLFIILTISLSIIPAGAFGVLEQNHKIHHIYDKPGVHFVIPFIQKMYIYHQTTRLNFESVLIAPINRTAFNLTMTIDVKIKDIKAYHGLVKHMTIHDELLIVMAKFIENSTDTNTLQKDLIDYLLDYLNKEIYPFTTTHIQILDFHIA